MKFLDSNGLTYLWGKIKGFLGEKGDNIDLSGRRLRLRVGNDVISFVDLPEAGDIYATEETVIGTWIDGRPLYRQVFIYTPGDVSPGAKYPLDSVSPFIDTFMVPFSFVTVDGHITNLPNITPEFSYTKLEYDETNHILFYYTTESEYTVNVTITVIAMYTKETDPPTI